MRLSKEQLIQKIKQTLKQVGTSQMSQSPYDLGWLLRLPAGRHGLSDPKNYEKPRYPQIISWLEKLQHKDGSWGGTIPFAHDRVISTLSVIAGLSRWSLDEKWRGRIAKAVKAVEIYSKKLLNEPEATVAFELLFPKLLNDCEKAGVKIKIPARVLNYYSKLKKVKLSKLPIEAATKQPTTLLHALEALDENKIDLRKFLKFQFTSGSFGSSPAATAYLIGRGVDSGERGISYLDSLVSQGIIPTMTPLEIFEQAWCLFPFALFGLDRLFKNELRPLFAYLDKSWTAKGVGPSREFLIPDLDDTAMVFYLLAKNNKPPDSKVFEKFETDDGFMCFPGERSGSGSYYAHLLFALSTCASDKRIERMRRKALHYLLQAQNSSGFWDDKWHGSPWYVTSRIALALLANQYEHKYKKPIEKAIRWIIKTRRPNGLWGMGKGTAEETSYALMALMAFHKNVAPLNQSMFQRAQKRLEQRINDKQFPELWIGKALFAENAIAKITILTTLLALYETEK